MSLQLRIPGLEVQPVVCKEEARPANMAQLDCKALCQQYLAEEGDCCIELPVTEYLRKVRSCQRSLDSCRAGRLMAMCNLVGYTLVANSWEPQFQVEFEDTDSCQAVRN